MANSLIQRISKNKSVKDFIYEKEEIPPDFIGTGGITLNILFSGRANGGIPVGKISQMAAPSSLGKTFVGMKVAKNAQKKGDDWIVLYIDTEMAFDYSFAESVGVDLDRILVVQSNQIEDIQQQIMAFSNELSLEERKKTLLVIDSWGGLVTSKTVSNAETGNDAIDFTPAKKKNTLARLMTGMGMTVFVINQIYETMNQYDPYAIPGGNGLYFACSSIVLATHKSKAKDTASSTDIIGAGVLAHTRKSRFCKEHSKLRYLIRYDGGIDPFHGLLDDALEGGYVDKPTIGYYTRVCVEGDKKWRERELNEKGEEFWTPVLKNTDFLEYIERKYTFLHSEISDDDFDWDSE
jgi:RecA/RadA recombinase